MNIIDAFHVVGENALLHAAEDQPARLSIYDALAVLALHAGLFVESAEATAAAAALRGAETLEFQFRRRLRQGRGEKP